MLPEYSLWAELISNNFSTVCWSIFSVFFGVLPVICDPSLLNQTINSIILTVQCGFLCGEPGGCKVTNQTNQSTSPFSFPSACALLFLSCYSFATGTSRPWHVCLLTIGFVQLLTNSPPFVTAGRRFHTTVLVESRTQGRQPQIFYLFFSNKKGASILWEGSILNCVFFY